MTAPSWMKGSGKRLAGGLARLWVGIANTVLWITRSVLFPRTPEASAKRLLMIRSGYIGDLIVTVPAIQRLTETLGKDGKIALLTGSTAPEDRAPANEAAELLREWSLIDRVMYLPAFHRRFGAISASIAELLRTRKQMKEFRPDRAILLPYTYQSFKGVFLRLILLRMLGGRVKPEGCAVRSLPVRFRRLQRETGLVDHQVVTALRAAGVKRQEALRCPWPPLPVLQGPRRTAQGMLERFNGRPIVALGCAAKYWHKMWPTENFIFVVNAISARREIAWAVLGAAKDRDVARQVSRAAGGVTIDLCGQLALAEAAEILRLSAAYLGNDSGLAHLAAAVGVPTVTIFSGVHHPGVWDPWGGLNTSLRAEVACGGCEAERSCPKGDKHCLTEIRPATVIVALDEALTRRARLGRAASAAF